MYDVTPITSKTYVDCGPACLAMLLNYYGEPWDQDQLIKECGCELSGCTAADLMRVGRAHGLDMKSYKTDLEGLLKSDRPAICWWKYTHFIVFCGLDDQGQVVICNPDRGRYPISQGTFAALYSGIALTNGEMEDLPEE
jgi:ABC-type bacteriocin/lantibiotic exporter with double-glycine peptidase domain